MPTWVLVLIVWGTWDFGGPAPAPGMTSIPGYVTEEACKLAGVAFVDEDFKRRVTAGSTDKNMVTMEFRCIRGPDRR